VGVCLLDAYNLEDGVQIFFRGQGSAFRNID
jgi:hypothetical protein